MLLACRRASARVDRGAIVYRLDGWEELASDGIMDDVFVAQTFDQGTSDGSRDRGNQVDPVRRQARREKWD